MKTQVFSIKFRLLLLLGLVFGLFGMQQSANAESCGKVSIASMNWQSAEVIAEIDKIILKEGYGCKVEIVSGDTQPTLTSMIEKGEPDVAPEAWINAIRVVLNKAIDDGRLHYGAKVLEDGGVEGFWIPTYTAKQYPDIKTIDDALKHPELFPAPEAPNRGAVFGCPSGWACQIVVQNAFNAWKGDSKGFDLIDPGSAAGLDGSIAKAYERKQHWFGYYWAPTSILGKYPMVRLDAGVPHDPQAWKECNSQNDCQNPVKNDWAVSDVYTVITDRFKKTGGIAFNYLSTRSWNNSTVNELLAWMLENQATGEDGAYHFLENYPQIWNKWVPESIAKKVSKNL